MRSGSWQAAALAAVVAGCAAHRAPGDPFSDHPIRTASREELARRIDADAAAVRGVKGKLTLELEEAARRRTCRGALAARNPWIGDPAPGLYVQGYRPLTPALFTLVSDGERFWLHVPSKRVVYTGPVAHGVRLSGGQELRLDARALLRALFVEPVEAADRLELEEEPSAYVLSLHRDGHLHRRLWVERRRFAVVREVYYDAEGREELAIRRERPRDVGGRVYPERLIVQDRLGSSTLLLDFDALAVNPADLDSGAFQPRIPPEARIVTVGAAEDP
jgi:hypothetical protein